MTRVFFAPLLLLFALTPRLSLLANLFSLFSPICLSHASFLVANPVLYSRASPGSSLPLPLAPLAWHAGWHSSSPRSLA